MSWKHKNTLFTNVGTPRLKRFPRILVSNQKLFFSIFFIPKCTIIIINDYDGLLDIDVIFYVGFLIETYIHYIPLIKIDLWSYSGTTAEFIDESNNNFFVIYFCDRFYKATYYS